MAGDQSLYIPSEKIGLPTPVLRSVTVSMDFQVKISKTLDLAANTFE